MPELSSNTRARLTKRISGLTLIQTDVCFLLCPLCKVDPKLCTDLLMLGHYSLSYAQANVDNC